MQQVVLKHELTAAPIASDFELISTDSPDCPDKGFLVDVKYISLDPYIGHLLNKGHMGQTPPKIGVDKIPGAIVGEVIESRRSGVNVGDYIHSMDGGWAETVALSDNQYTIIDPDAAPLESYVGVLGMPGLTAWASVTQRAQVHDGDVYSVNAAAGPVGGTAGQIARMKGAKTVIGIAGSAEKCKMVEDLYGFDICVNYKTDDWIDRIKQAAPDGVTVHHENVGAEQLAVAMGNLSLYGRVVLCGLAAHYHDPEPARTLIGPILGKRASLLGLVVYDFYDRWEEFRHEVAPWVKTGKVTITQDRVEGLAQAGALMEKLMSGQNVGKCVVAL